MCLCLVNGAPRLDDEHPDIGNTIGRDGNPDVTDQPGPSAPEVDATRTVAGSFSRAEARRSRRPVRSKGISVPIQRPSAATCHVCSTMMSMSVPTAGRTVSRNRPGA